MSKYDDIIDLPRHRSLTHPHMAATDRAAQFAPFAALVGFDEAIGETARLTDERPRLDEQQLARLDELLTEITANPNANVRVTYFVADERTEGGRYEQAEGAIKRIDGFSKTITLESGEQIPMEDIVDFSE
ncbi:MAG: YolD-like family protein [Candidatus Gallimonas sp.]